MYRYNVRRLAKDTSCIRQEIHRLERKRRMNDFMYLLQSLRISSPYSQELLADRRLQYVKTARQIDRDIRKQKVRLDRIRNGTFMQ